MTNSTLTLKDSKIILSAIEKYAESLSINLVISIYDNHGNLNCFHRMDNTSFGSIRISQLKALTSASMPISSKDLSERSASMTTNPYSSIPDILLLGGGLPIMKNGIHIGSIGVSGATPELDEECAQKGIDALLKSSV
ncbi:heme-binding protein [Francisellaceae bacterium]|nr:heme-binding protein [Francisellaceae bacterium]